jgi:exo-1,4-beta-D-glucosaminidase
MDLSITWVDWNPTPPDVCTGIWYDVKVTISDSVEMRHPHVVTELDLPSLDVAHLTISVELINAKDKPITGTLKGIIKDVDNIAEGGTSKSGGEEIYFSQSISLAPNENKLVTFSPDDFDQLNIHNPRLWWPNNVGPQNLYDLELIFKVNGETSDTENVRFGIREVSSEMNSFDGKLTRVFQINGKNIVIRGGGYVEDMMLRPSRERDEADIMYAKEMNLNTLRMEGVRGSDYLYDLCDKYGIMTMVGLCCCCSWEGWDKWTHTADIAELSWRDEVIRLRNHPCIFDWLYGSDKYPPTDIEARYIDVLETYDGTRPYQSSATSACSDIAGCTGLYMGPWPDVYAYFPPSYWYTKLEFNTEAGPSGEQICPIESMRKMMPEEEIWSPATSDSWNLRLHRSFYPKMRMALYSRYGIPTGIEEYCMKSQILQKEATRAMFEAFARNKYQSSGIIYWMYNSVWPTLYWQFFDYYLTPNGAFYGAKKACEPLHVQYSYDDDSIYVVNSYYQSFENLKVIAKVYNLDMTEKYSNSATISIPPDSSNKVFTIDWPKDLSKVYFLKLELKDKSDNLISSNLYWLSTEPDESADFSDLDKLPDVDLDVSYSIEKKGNTYIVYVDLKNPSSNLAFAVNPKIKKSISKDLVLPIYWEDNYFSLLPGETRKVKVEFSEEDLEGKTPFLEVGGWNIVKEIVKK